MTTTGRRALARLVVLLACLVALAPAAHAQVDPCVADPTSCLPDVPDVPGAPEVPDVPDVPDVPEVPDVPDVPEVPDAPDVPDVDQCVADPSSCLPPAPDPGGCVADPASCLPPPPDPDGCVADPSSCLPGPDPDECVANPQRCLPDVPGPDPDRCVADPQSCLPALDDPPPADPEDVVEEVERCVDDPNPLDCLGKIAVDPDELAACLKDPRSCASGVTDKAAEVFQDLADVLAAEGISPDELARADRLSADELARIRDREGAADAGEDALTEAGDPDSDDVLASLFGGRPDDGSAGGGLLGRIGGIFGDIVGRFGFPLALVGLAAIFLAIQNRLDREDPKLALAPVDSTPELLTFK
jgi:hypothetical protein